ncbi:MAG: hypothetical protein II013_04925 [Lachnobacterium sp.]|nr:hypothetical protein [Lachnobacterium sp.]
MRKITRNNINQENMVALSYCQAQTALNLFGTDYKIGYNAGVYGWNYDLYRIGGVDVVTGYNCPYINKSNKKIKTQLIAFENKLRKLSSSELCEKGEELKKEFLNIFE